MKIRALIFMTLLLSITIYSPLFSQGISDPVGDASPPSVDYVMHYFEQQGESLYVAVTMNDVITNRIQGYSTHTFFCDTDADHATGQPGSRVGSENNMTFTDMGSGVWFMRQWVLWNHDPAYNSFAHRNLSPVKFSADGKTMSYKMSLVGTGWEEIEYDFNGWYKDGTSWHQVPHYPGDAITEAGLLAIDVEQVTPLVTKEGTYCTIDVPEPYSAIAAAKNITGVVDEMMTLVRAEIGTISDAARKYYISYEMFGNYTKPYPYITGKPNFLTTRIPGQYWIDEPDWWGMLDGLINMTALELSAGAAEILLTQNSYHIPIPGSKESWYCTHGDSVQGFLWDAFHKYTFKALLGRAYENCFAFYIADKMTAGAAKNAILAKKAEAQTAWANFTGTARDLTPLEMTGFLLAQSTDLSWTKTLFSTTVPKTLNLTDDANAFTQLIKATTRADAFAIISSTDFLNQEHHGWYGTLGSLQAAAIGAAMNKEIYSALLGITDFPMNQAIYDQALAFFMPVETELYGCDDSVPFVWTEINTIGTAIGRTEWRSQWMKPDADDGAVRVPLGINFPFYNQTFDSITISVNGIMSFTDWADWITSSGYGQTIPGMGWNNIVCPLACDLMNGQYPNAPYLSRSGTVYHYSDPAANKFIVEYENICNHHFVVNDACTDTTITFQIVFDANDASITFYYKDLGIANPPCAERATIGIQPSKDGTLGVQYYGGNLPAGGYPKNQSAVRFYLLGTGVAAEKQHELPTNFQLSQNYPNPFNPKTSFTFSIPEPTRINVKVYDMLGKEVATLVDNEVLSGIQSVSWNAADLPSGIYFYRLEAGRFSITRKCVLLK